MKQLIYAMTLSASCAMAQPDTILGYAYDAQKINLHYVESYTQVYGEEGQLKTSQVQYLSPTQEILAVKRLDYHHHPYAPNFNFSNRVNGYSEAVEWLTDGSILIKHREQAKTWQEKVIQVAEPVVADAGFNAFLVDHLGILQQGDNVQFNFLNPARLDWYRFSAQAVDRSNSVLRIKVAPANSVLRWLVDPIFLTYQLADADHAQPRLLQYSGLTNISLQDNKPVVANIFYQYESHQAKQIVNRF